MEEATVSNELTPSWRILSVSVSRSFWFFPKIEMERGFEELESLQGFQQDLIKLCVSKLKIYNDKHINFINRNIYNILSGKIFRFFHVLVLQCFPNRIFKINEDALVSENIIISFGVFLTQFQLSLEMIQPSWFHQLIAFSRASNSYLRSMTTTTFGIQPFPC